MSLPPFRWEVVLVSVLTLCTYRRHQRPSRSSIEREVTRVRLAQDDDGDDVDGDGVGDDDGDDVGDDDGDVGDGEIFNQEEVDLSDIIRAQCALGKSLTKTRQKAADFLVA